MRILSGPAHGDSHFAVHEASRAARDHDVLRFGPDAVVAEIPYHAGKDDWDAVLARLPSGWQPDLVLFWDPHYQALPPGLERNPCPIVAIFMDWFFWPQRAGLYAGFFDALLTNRTGALFLGAAGLPVAGEVNYLGVDWARFAADPAAPRDVDVCMVTSFHHLFRARRARHLERLARMTLSGLRLHVTNDAYGAAYPALLARAKVAFNDSDFAILNTRTFEGLAAGAAVMEEAANPEARALFSDGVDLVFYPEHDIEERLRALLGDDAARVALARRGQERARAFSYEARVAAAIDRAAAVAGDLRPEERGVAGWRAVRVYGAGAVLALSALNVPEDLAVWQHAYVDLPLEVVDDVPLLCGLAWVGLTLARTSRSQWLPIAARALERALAVDREDPVARFNAGRLRELAGQADLAQRVWEELAAEAPELPHVARHGWYADEMLVNELLHQAVNPEVPTGEVLRQGALLALARLHERSGATTAALRYYRAAEEVAEHTAMATATARLRASAAAKAADLDEVVDALRAACARGGMEVEAWLDYAQVLLSRGDKQACREWCRERGAMLAGFPTYEAIRSELAPLADASA